MPYVGIIGKKDRHLMRKLTHQKIVERQKLRSQQPRLPVCVVLNDIRSLYNVGSIFRTCDGAGFEKIWLCGITGYPPQAEIAKIALGAEERVPWEYRKDACALIKELKRRHYRIILLEQTEESVPFQDFTAEAPLCLVIGNEIGGISDEIAELCDTAVEIEMAGIKNSLNVSVAFGIVAYHFRHCLNKTISFQK